MLGKGNSKEIMIQRGKNDGYIRRKVKEAEIQHTRSARRVGGFSV